jgi:hypothetical protein
LGDLHKAMNELTKIVKCKRSVKSVMLYLSKYRQFKLERHKEIIFASFRMIPKGGIRRHYSARLFYPTIGYGHAHGEDLETFYT